MTIIDKKKEWDKFILNSPHSLIISGLPLDYGIKKDLVLLLIKQDFQFLQY